MKILHIINTLSIGGAERLVTEIACNINKKKNISCAVLILANSDSDIYIKELLSENVQVYTACSPSVYNPLLIFKIRPYIKKYDIVHVHLFPAQYWVAFASLLVRKRLRPKLITTEHNTENRRRKIPVFKFIDAFVYSKYQLVTCISQGTIDNLRSYLPKLKKIVLVNNGVNLSKFNRKLHKLPSSNVSKVFKLIMVAGFRPQKDQDTVIKSLVYLPNEIELYFVGDGERKKHCLELVTKLSLSKRIHFLGLRGDIPQLLSSSDLAIISSHWEGFGLVAAEAMATGIPVIGSDVSGLREVIKGAGLLFKSEDAKELAEKVLLLYNNKEDYNKVADKCYEKSKLYDVNNMFEALMELYKELYEKTNQNHNNC